VAINLTGNRSLDQLTVGLDQDLDNQIDEFDIALLLLNVCAHIGHVKINPGVRYS